MTTTHQRTEVPGVEPRKQASDRQVQVPLALTVWLRLLHCEQGATGLQAKLAVRNPQAWELGAQGWTALWTSGLGADHRAWYISLMISS